MKNLFINTFNSFWRSLGHLVISQEIIMIYFFKPFLFNSWCIPIFEMEIKAMSRMYNKNTKISVTSCFKFKIKCFFCVVFLLYKGICAVLETHFRCYILEYVSRLYKNSDGKTLDPKIVKHAFQ